MGTFTDVKARYEAEMKVTGADDVARGFGKVEKSALGAADGMGVLARQHDVGEKSITRIGSKIEALTRKYDQHSKAVAELNRAEALFALHERNGGALTPENIRALEKMRENVAKLSGGMNDNTKEVALNRAGWINLSRQLQDVGVSLAGGMSPFMVLTQQGGQIADVFTSSKGGATAALKEFGAAVTGFVLNPVTLLVGGIAALTAALVQFESEQTRLQRAVNGSGAFSGMTADQLRQAGLAGAAAGGMSASQGIESAATLAGTGRISGSMIPGLISRSQKYADAFGMDQADALKELAKAFSDPVNGAKLLDERLGFLDGRTKEYIRTLRDQGRELDAQKALFDAFDASLKKTEDTTWSLTRAWRLFKSGLFNPFETAAQAIDNALITPKTGAQMAAERAAAQRAAREQKANRDSIEITDRVTKFIPEIGARQSLKDSAAFFNNAENNTSALAKMGVSMSDFSKAQDIANVKLGTFATESEKAREASDTRIKSMSTLNERTKAEIEAQQTYTDTLRETGDRQLAATKADAMRAEALARVNAAVRQYNDAAKDQLALAGLSPYQRQKAAIGIEAKNFQEQYGVVPSGVADKMAALKKDTAYSMLDQPTDALQKEIDLLKVKSETLGQSNEKVAEAIAWQEKYNELRLAGVDIGQKEIDKINEYAAKAGERAKVQEALDEQNRRLAGSLDVVRSTTKDVGESLVNAFRKGENAITALQNVLDRLTSKLLDKTLDTAINSLFGKTGTAETGSAGGFLATAISGLGSLFKFADGGIMTSAGPVPLMAYAGGGVADRPQMALFGEGRRPEAFVPLPDGRNIPVRMQGQGGGLNVKVINNVAGAQPEVRQMSDGELVVVINKMIQANNAKVPGIVANSQRRAM